MKGDATKRNPKHLQLKNALREKIRRGEFGTDSKMPSEHELIRAYGFSRITVIRAMRDLQAEGVITRHRGKGTFVNQGATVRGQIGILTYMDESRPILSAYPQNLLRGMLNRLRELGEAPHIYTTHGTEVRGDIHKHGKVVLDDCSRGKVRCLILDTSYHSEEVEAAVKQWGVQVVGSNTECALTKFNCAADLGAVAEEGILYLLGRGVRKIALLVGKPWHSQTHNEVKAYLRLMEEHELSIRPGWVRSDAPATEEAGYDEFCRLWKMNEHPDAILVMDDIMAQGATRAMVDLRIDVPRELTPMILVNRWSGLGTAVPALALEIDTERIAAACAELACDLVHGRTVENPHVWLKPDTSIHETTGVAYALDPASGRDAVSTGKIL